MMSLIQCVILTVTFLCVQTLMSVQKREMAVSTFAEIQLAPIIVCVEMDIICIKMGNLAWVGSYILSNLFRLFEPSSS